MIYIAYFILAFALIQLAVATSNLLFRDDLESAQAEVKGLVSVLIPARNEEIKIGDLLSDLAKMKGSAIEIIVFNDQSTDQTEAIVKHHTAKDPRIQLINSEGLPEGWLGKNNSCYQLARQANGDYLLFLDADVRVEKGIIEKAVAVVDKHKLGLLSIFPKQLMHSLGERMTVPNMNFILLSLLPLALVRKLKFPSLAAANGQFMLFRSDTYYATQPHEKFKANKVEDIEIARYLKREDIKIACTTGDSSISCRMYAGFDEAVHGFSKNVINYFGNSYLLATLFWLITSFGFIPILMQFGSSVLIGYLLVVILTRVVVSATSQQNAFKNLLWIVAQQLSMGFFIYKAIENKFKKQYQWKDRNISC